MIKEASLFIIANLICCNCQVVNLIPTTVSTSYGEVIGTSIPVPTNPQRQIVAFRGIPFAEPPTGTNRFRDPQPLMGWRGTKDANKRVQCPQINPRFKVSNQYPYVMESEDCLYLNIFYPAHATTELRNLPVLVYFHGGEFNYGGKDYYDPDILLREKDMVLVTVNYRLGVLGFLSTNDTHIPGNFGIKDQRMALNFIFKEIENFKGDRQKITIFGHDAGAISVDIHRLIPSLNAPLFQNAISSGGTVFTPWAFQENAYDNAYWFAANLSCSSTKTDKILYCLQQKSYNDLIAMQRQYDFTFRPIVDKNSYDPLLIDDPIKLYQTADLSRHRHLFGLTSKEGALEFYARYHEFNQLSDNKKKIKRMFEPYFKLYTNKEAISVLIHYKYFDSKNTIQTQETDNTLINILGSYLYEGPTDKALRIIGERKAKHSLYVFEYKGQNTFGSLLQQSSTVNRESFGVTHNDDIFYLFTTPLYSTVKVEHPYSTHIVNCLYSFMTEYFDNLCQMPYFNGRETNTFYYAIDAGANIVSRHNFKPNEELKFWNELVFDIERLTSLKPPYFDYSGYTSYRSATWSLLTFLLLIIVAVVCVIIYVIVKKRKEKSSLKFLKKRDNELEERYNFL